jgi:hypothetical protein
MSLNAKIGIAVAFLVAVVFAVTIISQLPPPVNPDDADGDKDVPKEALRTFVRDMQYDPTSPRAEVREYQQYFETGVHTVPFWVCNANPVPVTVAFVYTSCTACSLAEFAVVPALPFDPEGDPDPFGAVVGGVTGKQPLDFNDSAFGLNHLAHRARAKAVDAVPPADWQRLKPPGSNRDDIPDRPSVEIPAAPSADKPVWVAVRLNIKVTQDKKLVTHFTAQRADSPTPVPLELTAVVMAVEPCRVAPTLIDFHTVKEDQPWVEETVYFWSNTRGRTPSADGLLGPLPPPDVTADSVRRASPHLSFTPPVPATAAELAALPAMLNPDPTKGPAVRVAGAYKTTLRFTRTAEVNGKKVDADLGPFERTIGLPPDGGGLTQTKTPTFNVRANLLGAVRLAEGKNVKEDKIDFGSFPARSELVREVGLVAEKGGIELEAVPDLCEPKYLKLDPDLKAEQKGDRTRWTMTLRIAANVGGGELKSGSVVVLRIKGTGQLIRIPVAGRGTS